MLDFLRLFKTPQKPCINRWKGKSELKNFPSNKVVVRY